jgi:hypothetical protein
MTTMAEKRSEVDLIAGFLVIVFGFAAFRGAENAPIVRPSWSSSRSSSWPSG